VVIALAILAHEKDLIALSIHGKGSTHDLFGQSIVVIPGVVEKVDAFVDGRMHQANGIALGVFLKSDARHGVPTAEGEDRYLVVKSSKRSAGQSGTCWSGLRSEYFAGEFPD
jgi:hypothetical protein